MFVNTNHSAAQAMRYLSNTTSELNKSYQQLSSGKRINSAADDAAGLAISTRLSTQINALDQINRNVNDGISYAQVAEGALNEVAEMNQRMYQLAIQAANGSLTEVDRQALNAEFQDLKEEIDRIAQTTEIFGHYPLLGVQNSVPSLQDIFPSSGSSGTFGSGVRSFAAIPAGSTNVQLTIDSFGADDDLQLFTQDGRHVAGTDLNDYVWNSNGISTATDVENTLFTTDNGYSASANYDDSNLNSGSGVYSPTANHNTTYNGMTISYGGDSDRSSPSDGNNNGLVTAGSIETITIDTVTEHLLIAVIGNGSFNMQAQWSTIATIPPGKNTQGPFQVLVSTTPSNSAGDFITIDKTPSTPADLGINALDISSQAGAQTAISALQASINALGGYRSQYGAKANVLAQVTRSASLSHENVSAANSRIVDSDFASTSAKLAKDQVLQQSAQSMLAQANLQPDIALTLLKN